MFPSRRGTRLCVCQDSTTSQQKTKTKNVPPPPKPITVKWVSKRKQTCRANYRSVVSCHKSYHKQAALGGELDEVEVELLCRVVEAVLIDGLDALCRQPQPHPSVSLLPEEPPLLKVNVLHLS